MTLPDIMEKLKIALSSAYRVSRESPILFHAIMENGAVFYRLPISAFIQRGFKPEEVPRRRLDELGALELF